MEENVSICFPHLGITIKNLKNTFSVFGIDIAYYGLVIGLGMLAAMVLAFHDAKKSGQNVDDYADLALFGILFAILGARLYYVIFQWDYYKAHFGEIFNLRKGGLAIYGGIIAGVIVCVVLARKRKLSVWRMLDTGAIGLVTGQMIGRWGNFFNREAYGGNTDNLFAMRININDPNVYVNVESGVNVIDGSYIQVHPTFLYESLWCLCILIAIELLKKKKKFYGEVFLWYISAYAFGRFFIEGLRTDQLKFWGTGIAVSQLLSAVLFFGGVWLCFYNHLRIARGQATFFVGAKNLQNEVMIKKAMHFAKKAHQGQTWTLENGKEVSYYEGHLMGVYHLIEGFFPEEEEMQVTALLHDVMEDTDVSGEEIREEFGDEIAENVFWLTKEENVSYNDYIDELVEKGSDETILVKLADRLHNTRNLMNLGSEEWHEKKIDQAKYMIDVIRRRKLAGKYDSVKRRLLAMISKDVTLLEKEA